MSEQITIEVGPDSVVLKGGLGSGFFNHAGIPGHQGGSAAEESLPAQDQYDIGRLNPEQKKKYFAVLGEGHVHHWALAIAEGQKPSSYARFADMKRMKGGPGSGNWNHMGREGQRGGSEPTVQERELTSAEKKDYDKLQPLSKKDYLAHRSAGMDHDVAIALAEPDIAYAKAASGMGVEK